MTGSRQWGQRTTEEEQGWLLSSLAEAVQIERAKADLTEARECLWGRREAVGSIGLDRGGVVAGVMGPIIIIFGEIELIAGGEEGNEGGNATEDAGPE